MSFKDFANTKQSGSFSAFSKDVEPVVSSLKRIKQEREAEKRKQEEEQRRQALIESQKVKIEPGLMERAYNKASNFAPLSTEVAANLGDGIKSFFSNPGKNIVKPVVDKFKQEYRETEGLSPVERVKRSYSKGFERTKKVFELAADVPRYTFRAGAKVGATLTELATGQDINYKPTSKVGKYLFGEELKSFGESALEAENKIKELGGSKFEYGVLPVLGITAGTFLDIYPGGKAEKTILKEFTEASIRDVIKIAEKNGLKLSDDAIVEIAKAKDEKTVKSILEKEANNIADELTPKEIESSVVQISENKLPQPKVESPKQIPKESPQGRFHGTSGELKKLMTDEEMYSPQNIYGQGFYTTDNHSIAQGYSKKGKGGQPSIYDIKEKANVPVYNIEKPMEQDVLDAVNKFDTADMYPYKKGDTLRQVYDDIRELSASGEFSSDTAQEYFDSIKDIISEKGFRGIEHTGGKLTGKEPHSVKIYWNPSEDLTHTKLQSPSPIQTVTEVNKPGEKSAFKKIKKDYQAEISTRQATVSEKLDIPKIEQLNKKAIEFKKENKVDFDVPEETKFQFLQRQLQDKMNRLGLTQKKIKEAGGVIDEKADAYLQQELFHGRAADRIARLEEAIVSSKGKKSKSLLERMSKDKIDIDEFDLYQKALHAEERNLKVADINSKLPDGGSGMTTKEAKETLERLQKEGKVEKFEKYRKEFVENVIEKRLKILEQSGLEKKETIDRIRSAYKNYVPLKVIGKAQFGKMGKGFSVSGSNAQRVKGSTKERTNTVAQAILDLEQTIIKAEKNKVAQSLLKLVEQNPNEKLWKVETLKYQPVFDETGELVSLSPQFKFADNVIEVRVDGKIKLITIEDRALAEAIKNIGTERSYKFLVNINNYLRSINTVMNPEFIITNFERDIQTALINIGGEQGVKAAANVAKDVAPAMKGIWKDIKSGEGGKWGELYRDMKEQGGRVGYFDNKTIEEKTEELLKKVSRYNSDKTNHKLANVLDSVGQYIERTNEVVESAVRLSAYKNALEAGATKAQAASIAKNLTVNFNKRGNMGVMLNSLYLFANAGIQGSARLLTALKYKKVRRIAYGIAAASYGINEMNRAINKEEYEKIPDYEKDTNLIFMMPNGNHINIKLPYGYNIFKVAGDVANNVVHGNTTPEEEIKHLFLALESAFNPLQSGTLSQLVSPTFTDPFIQHSENKNWFGGNIKPEQFAFGAEKRESSLYFSSVRKTSKSITEWLNKVTGGSEVEAGKIDFSPEILDHYVDFFTGGLGKTIANTFETGKSVVRGDLPDISNMPFVNKVVKKPFKEYAQTQVYAIQRKSGTEELSEKELNKFRVNIKNAFKDGSIDEKQGKRMVVEVLKNQAKIKAGRAFTEMEGNTPEEKKKIFESLNSLERDELKKIIINKYKE